MIPRLYIPLDSAARSVGADDVARAMLDNGYETTLGTLSKKTQAQIRAL